jgi:hypothetical protein
MAFVGNRGEWSEAYVLLRLLAHGRIQLSDAKLQPDESKTFEIESLSRKSKNENFELEIRGHEIFLDSSTIATRTEVQSAADLVFERVSKRGAGKSITIPEVELLLSRLRLKQLAAGSGSKDDLTLRVLDPYLRLSQSLDFSIKSMLGSAATLLNASKATNFRFELLGDASVIRTLSKFDGHPVDLISAALSRGVVVKFDRPCNETFESNLIMVDSRMPEIVAHLLLAHYSGVKGHLAALIEHLTKSNPLEMTAPLASTYYRHKLKTLLIDCALGMTPSRVWSGEHSSNGGYIIVARDGALHCLHAFERDSFGDYLVSSTKLERGDLDRHAYGELVESVDDDGNPRFHVLLNFQIRFVK